MSAALLAKLKVKKPPEARQTVQVVVPVPGVRQTIEIKAKILDKRADDKVDRQKFIGKIRARIIPKPVPVSLEDAPTIILDDKPIAPKKRTKRLKLETSDQGPKEAKVSSEEKPLGIVIKRKKRKTKSPIGVVRSGPTTMLQIGDLSVDERVGAREDPIGIRLSSYYLNNREIFVSFMSSLFGQYKEELRRDADTASCDAGEDSIFTLMPHQKIVRDYVNLYTPYRGLLLYHGLGSGKTCSSIAIAEGMKTSKQIIVMTPASLRRNYVEELKKCGDSLYRKNQFWEFVSISENPELIDTLSNALNLSVESIRKNGGAWLVNIKKPPNFEALSSSQKVSLEIQLDEMIMYKYKFINYNGLRMSHLRTLTHNFTINPFNEAVVIVDEAHNFVSRIVNKLNKKDTISGRLYEYLMEAKNAKVILLTGTPIINYPNEIAILFNILRGKIQTWYFKLTISGNSKVSEEYLRTIFKSTILGGNIMDFMEYRPTSTTLVITRNPFGFVNKTKDKSYVGVRLGDRGDLSDERFVQTVTKALADKQITVNPNGIRVEKYKALPDTLDDFKAYFIDDENSVKNMGLFKRRIMGLCSYFRSAQESLMPRFSKASNFHIVKIPMSQFQFGVYEEARVSERKLELQNARKRKKGGDGVFEEAVSTYRIFSRAFCNYVFPRPDIQRPMPSKEENLETAILKAVADEDLLDAATTEEKLQNVDGRYEADELVDALENDGYEVRIKSALATLEAQKQRFLSPEALQTYSPKFLNILENLLDPTHKGLHLIYSQFRTLEGIGILKLVLEANGFTRFRIKEMGKGNWVLDISEENRGKPMFALYTGTESAEEKEVIRNVFNGTWKFVPTGLVEQITAISSNNLYGEIIKVLMITASGAEGISLRNVRYVHITEPYWHPVRMQQVIGRARRICSHQDLPEEERTVDVFLYLMTFSEQQLASDESIELRLRDKSKLDNLTPVTSDEALYEIATLKEDITDQILLAVKEASIDCSLHSRAGDKEQLKCLTFGDVDSTRYSFAPSFTEEEVDTVADRNKVKITWKAVELELDGVKYALNKQTGDVYDLEEYNRGNPVKVGTLKIQGDAYKYSPI